MKVPPVIRTAANRLRSPPLLKVSTPLKAESDQIKPDQSKLFFGYRFFAFRISVANGHSYKDARRYPPLAFCNNPSCARNSIPVRSSSPTRKSRRITPNQSE